MCKPTGIDRMYAETTGTVVAACRSVFVKPVHDEFVTARSSP